MAADHFSFDTSVICQVVQDCAGLFASSFSSDIRTVSLSIIHKLDSSSGMFNLCLSAMTDIDIEAILFHLQKQSLLPASELLCVLDLASQYGKVSKCHEAIEILSTIEVEEQRIKAAVNTLHSAAQGIHLETTLSITELLLQLPEFLGRFKTSITQIDTISHARLSFPLLKEILNELDKIVCRLETSSPQSVVCELNNILLDAVNELLPGKCKNTR